MQRAVIAFNEDAIGKFQRVVDHKQDFVRRAKLNDGVLEKDIFVFAGIAVAIAVAIAVGMDMSAAEFDREFAPGWLREKISPNGLRFPIRARERLPGWALKPQSRGSWNRLISLLPGLEELLGDSICFIGTS